MENKTKKKGLLERITSSRVFRVMFSRQNHRGLRDFASHHGAYRHLRTGDCSL